MLSFIFRPGKGLKNKSGKHRPSPGRIFISPLLCTIMAVLHFKENIMPSARYAVFGNPIAHSKSPQIHQAFAAQEGVNIVYEKILADEAGFETAVQRFFDEGGQGANVTLPFKVRAFHWAQSLSADARGAGAVNTLIRAADGIRGENTDGIGLVRDISHNLKVTLSGKRILLLGAGGAVRGVIQPLLNAGPSELIIANRTPEKAAALAEEFSVSSCPFERLDGRFDIIINGTSGSLSGSVPDIPPSLFGRAELAYDMVYGSEPTAFLRHAAQQGVQQAADGLGMLVEQAAFSYHMWRSFRPDTAPLIRMLRESL